ncbi:MAG: hypothetical protein R3C01_03385 [Planctomycetaceae bacterium]
MMTHHLTQSLDQRHTRLRRAVLGTLSLLCLLLHSGQGVIEVTEDERESTLPVYQEPDAEHPSVALDHELFSLDQVRDRRPLDDLADTISYYGVLNHVRRVDADALKKAASEFLDQRWKVSEFKDYPRDKFEPFVDMWLQQNPRHPYRGQPVTLAGHLNLLRVRDHDVNPYGLSPVYEAYLYTDDSQSYPATIIFTENPDQLPAGAQRSESVEVTGYFLKMYSYRAVSGKTNYSPLILAKEIRYLPANDITFSSQTQILIAVAIIALIGLLLVFLWWSGRAERQRRRQRQQAVQASLPPID